MSIFSICDYESEVQLLDKTRFNASKAFAPVSSDEVSSLTIKAGLDGTAIDVFNPDVNERYLDWCFSAFAIDVNSSNNFILFKEGGVTKSGTVASGNAYTLANYATAVAAAMTTAGTQTYTASVTDSKVTISAPTLSFQFLSCAVSSQCFFDLDETKLSHTGGVVEYGVRAVTVASGNGTDTNTLIVYPKVYTEAGDYLFSNDGDLTAHEPDIMKWVGDGRASFKNVHRRSQKLIIAWLDEKGYVNTYGKKYTKHDIIDLEEVRQWSIFMTLRLIFQGLSNAIDDVFDRKAKMYELNEQSARQRVILRLDSNSDGQVDEVEGVSIYSGSLFRR
jgi:hypothetical protein